MSSATGTDKLIEYNSIPVYYCERCLSLRVVGVDVMDTEFCDSCGSVNIAKTDIETWRKLYKSKYGKDYLENY